MTGQPDMLSFSDWQAEAVGSLSHSRIGSEPELDTAKRWEKFLNLTLRTWETDAEQLQQLWVTCVAESRVETS